MAENITGTTAYTNGAYQKPSAKDSGADVFQVLEDFMDRMSVHKHQGKDSEIISHTITKTSFYIAAEAVNWDAGSNDNKYVDIDITGNTLTANVDGEVGATPNDVNYLFYYVADSVDGISSPGHVRFYPDVSWVDYNTMRITSNIWHTIAEASAAARVYLKAY